jgi:hypothetical protein
VSPPVMMPFTVPTDLPGRVIIHLFVGSLLSCP